MGLIQRNTDEGRSLLENPSEMLTKVLFFILLLSQLCVVVLSIVGQLLY